MRRREFVKIAAAIPLTLQIARSEESSSTVRIALITDTHTTHATKEDQSLYIPRFEKVIEAVNSAAPDLILFAGDQTQNGKPDEVAEFFTLAKRLKAPMRWVAGNHDIGGKRIVGKGDGVTAERLANYEKQFGPSYFEDTIAGLRILGINTPALGSGLPIESAQWQFLDRSLGGNAIQDAKPTVVLLHYPPYLKEENEPGGGYWNIDPEPRSRLLKLLDTNRSVRAVLSGHLHYPIQYTRKNTLYQTSAPVSFGLPRGKQPQGWTLITVPLKGDTLPTSQFFPILDTKESKS